MIVGGSITGAVGIVTVNIYGHVQIGLEGGIVLGSLGGVGERSWQASNPGQIEPGWLTQTVFVAPPDITFPYTSGLVPGPGTFTWTNCINGTNCIVQTNYYDNVLYSGDYYATSLDGSTIVVGTARLVLPNGLNVSFEDEISINPGASVTIYVGTNSTIVGNGIINPSGLASSCEILCTPSVTNFTLNFAGNFSGIIVAPEAAVRVDGAGIETNDFMGALVANTLELNGNFNFHFDESLIQAPAQLGPPSWSNANQFLFSITGATGFSYIAEASTNLSDWVPLATNISPFIFVDNSTTNYPQRYYRAVRVP